MPIHAGEHDEHFPADAVRVFPHRQWLRSVLLARSRDPAVVDDLLQEVLLALARAERERIVIADIRPWLYRVAVRQALLHRRRMGRRRRLQGRLEQEQGSLPPHEPTDPLAWLLAVERQELIRTALEQLPGRESEMLLLKYTENWNYRQLAEHLGMTVAAVESRLHRARERLRQHCVRLQLTEVTR